MVIQTLVACYIRLKLISKWILKLYYKQLFFLCHRIISIEFISDNFKDKYSKVIIIQQ